MYVYLLFLDFTVCLNFSLRFDELYNDRGVQHYAHYELKEKDRKQQPVEHNGDCVVVLEACQEDLSKQIGCEDDGQDADFEHSHRLLVEVKAEWENHHQNAVERQKERTHQVEGA